MQAEVLSPGTYPDPSVGIFSQLFRWTPCRTGRRDAAFVQPDTGSAPLLGLCSRPLDRVFGLRCLWVFHRPNTGFSQTQRTKG